MAAARAVWHEAAQEVEGTMAIDELQLLVPPELAARVSHCKICVAVLIACE